MRSESVVPVYPYRPWGVFASGEHPREHPRRIRGRSPCWLMRPERRRSWPFAKSRKHGEGYRVLGAGAGCWCGVEGVGSRLWCYNRVLHTAPVPSCCCSTITPPCPRTWLACADRVSVSVSESDKVPACSERASAGVTGIPH